jgi:predicted site-specific integrase-resolvase
MDISTPTMESLLTTAQAAEVLRLKPKTLERWRGRGKGPPFLRIEGLPRYRASDLNAYIRSRETK